MNFWKRLRLIGSVVVLVIAVLTIVLTVLRSPDADSDASASPERTQQIPRSKSGTTGL